MLQKCVAWCFLLLGTLCVNASGQNFSKLYQMDSYGDGGMNIFIRSDNSYLFTAFTISPINKFYGIGSEIVSSDGQNISNKHIFRSTIFGYAHGLPGSAQRWKTGYVAPIGLFGYSHVNSGFIAFNSVGDTTIIRGFTDTTKYSDGANYISVSSDSTFYIVGEQDSVGFKPNVGYVQYKSWGYVQHMSSDGQLIWMRRYLKSTDSSDNNGFTSIQVLSNHNLLVGGTVRIPYQIQGYGFHFHHPWMLLLDSSGNVLKDTMYSNHYYPGAYVGGGNVFSDVNGGYFHWGEKDSTPTPYPQSVDYDGNFPSYMAHLDTNFGITWRVSFPPRYPNTTPGNGVAGFFQVIQTRDSGYLIMGDRAGAYVNGWLCELNKNGQIKWEHFYYKDSTQQAYLVDAEERPTGVSLRRSTPCLIS